MSGSFKRKSSDSDPGLWFPLLKGFFQRDHDMPWDGSNSNCDDPAPTDKKDLSLKALSVFKAERIISSWLLSILKKKRQGDEKATSHVKQHTHFLLRALTSSSLPVRRLAATIILDATDPMDLVRAHLNHTNRLLELDPAGRILLRDMFWTLAKSDIEDMVTYVTPSISNSTLYCPSHDGVIQIYGVLAHLIFDDDGAFYAHSCNREDDIGRMTTCCAIEHFIASGGMRWIAASLVRLISTLLREEGFANSHKSRWGRLSLPDESFAEAVQLRIILLVDLCNRLFMHVTLHPIRFPEGYWQSMQPENLEALFETEKSKIISRIENKRKDARVRTLFSAFHLLWSSQIPAMAVDCPQNSKGSTLSPLACLIACYAVLRREDDLNPLPNITTSTALYERQTSVSHDAHRSGFKNFFEVPLLPQRLEGINQALDCLQKMIDPTGNVFFTGATYPPTPKIDIASKAQSDNTKLAPTTSNSQAPLALDDQTSRKRSRSSSSENLSKKKMNLEVGDDISNGIRDPEQSAISMLLEERTRLLYSDQTTETKNDFVMESSGIGDEEEEDDEVPDEEYGHDDGMIDVDDEVDEEMSENDECSDYDPSGLAGINGVDATDTGLKVIGNQHKAERLSVSDASMSIISKVEREKSLIRASMEVLHAHYGSQKDNKFNNDGRGVSLSFKEVDGLHRNQQDQSWEGNDGSELKRASSKIINAVPLLTVSAEQFMLGSICDIVKPPPKPFKMKIVMKRATMQEEYFRGSLSKNPINLESLSGLNSPSQYAGGDDEPRVRDLRLHIARDLKMEDSAELLEILVGNKILGLGLKLRVVCQVIWKKYIMEKATSSSAGISSSFLPSTLLNRRSDSAPGYSLSSHPMNDVDAQNLPPMIITYRLIGVDGEATEERVEDGDLIDPEAPSENNASNEENEQLLEKEYGLTNIVTGQRGVHMLLKSLESYLVSCMKSIRRDNVARKYHPEARNTARALFLKSSVCPSLVLLRHCARLKENRAKMVKARAPTKLLRLLLDLLSCLEESRSPFDIANAESPSSTATGLQELIETLSSVIAEDIVLLNGETKSSCSEEEDDGSLRLLLSSLRTTLLSAPLRAVVSKLLPYLTYGQPQLSRDLATDFVQHVTLEQLGSTNISDGDSSIILMNTFVDCAIHLPPTPLFNHLRIELLKQNFVLNLVQFVERQMPDGPPHWCPALLGNNKIMDAEEKKLNENKWRIYFSRQGLTEALRMLVGLSTNHPHTQLQICGFHAGESSAMAPNNSVLSACHWIESISDFNDISTCGLGIQAETLLDTLSENDQLSTIISNIRSKTREQKKAIAYERRKALMVITSFPAAEGASLDSSPHATNSARKKSSQTHPSRDPPEKFSGIKETPLTSERLKPAEAKSKWLIEMESIEDETGLTCVVCQEGRKVQPKELLGLYAFAKRVVFSKSNVSSIDGTELLFSLPRSVPPFLSNITDVTALFDSVISLLDRMQLSQRDKSMPKNDTDTFSFDRVSTSSSSSFISTVSAGNAIHCSCHMKARIADKNHSKAPKSEWEGATLRNSRISCNVILPLVSASNSDVPTYSVNSYLEEYARQSVSIIGSQPKSILWLVLFDIRFLLLRVSCGESITQDCGGGSLRSNALLMFYMLMIGNKLKEKEADARIHASTLPFALILAWTLVQSKDPGMDLTMLSHLQVHMAEAAPMAAIASILFHNGDGPHKSNFWSTHRDVFCSCFMFLSGYRHALGIEGSGCESSRNSNSGRRLRSTSFHDWDSECFEGKAEKTTEISLMTKFKSFLGKRSSCPLDQYSVALRPMITMFIVIDQLAQAFAVGMNDDAIDQSSVILADVFESCHRAENLETLLRMGNLPIDKEKILVAFNEGLRSPKKK